MAQSVERILGKDEVPSSILGISTMHSTRTVSLSSSLKKMKVKSGQKICLVTIALWTHLIPCRTQK